MKSNQNLFKSGQVILQQKNYGNGTIAIAIILIPMFALALFNKIGLPNEYYYSIPLYVLCAFIVFWIAVTYIQPWFYPDSKSWRRYDDIVLFDDCLLGRFKGGKIIEEKIEFDSIKYIIQESDNEVNITLIHSEKAILKLNTNIFKGETQDYKFSNSLSKSQKKELVSYLNDRIKQQKDEIIHFDKEYTPEKSESTNLNPIEDESKKLYFENKFKKCSEGHFYKIELNTCPYCNSQEL
jgi:hypothetical protein